jgi:hypothetical protein
MPRSPFSTANNGLAIAAELQISKKQQKRLKNIEFYK